MTESTTPLSEVLFQERLRLLPGHGDTFYSYRGTGRERPRFYKHATEGWEYPGVTTVLKSWGSKEGLVNWAANLERESCLEAASLTWEQLRKTTAVDQLSGQGFAETIGKRLGEARSHQRAKEKAADIGTSAHAYVQWIIKGMLGEKRSVIPPEVRSEARIWIEAWDRHWEQAGIQPLRSEQVVWSKVHRYAGTLDLLALRNGKLGLLDWKSSKHVFDAHHYQLSAYAEALEEMTGLKIEWAEIWRGPKSTDAPQRVEVVPLGQVGIWNGTTTIPTQRSREELFRAFLGVLGAWNCTACWTD